MIKTIKPKLNYQLGHDKELELILTFSNSPLLFFFNVCD